MRPSIVGSALILGLIFQCQLRSDFQWMGTWQATDRATGKPFQYQGADSPNGGSVSGGARVRTWTEYPSGRILGTQLAGEVFERDFSISGPPQDWKVTFEVGFSGYAQSLHGGADVDLHIDFYGAGGSGDFRVGGFSPGGGQIAEFFDHSSHSFLVGTGIYHLKIVNTVDAYVVPQGAINFGEASDSFSANMQVTPIPESESWAWVPVGAALFALAVCFHRKPWRADSV